MYFSIQYYNTKLDENPETQTEIVQEMISQPYSILDATQTAIAAIHEHIRSTKKSKKSKKEKFS